MPVHRPPILLFIWVLLQITFVHGADTPVFAWRGVPQLTTCQSATLSWAYREGTGSNDDLTISITNFGVVEPSTAANATFQPHGGRGGPRHHPPSRRADITQRISGVVPASNKAFAWSSVNVSEGWYVLLATFPSSSSVRESSSFFVANGSDISCLLASRPPTSSTGPTSTQGGSSATGPSSGSSTTQTSSSPAQTASSATQAGSSTLTSSAFPSTLSSSAATSLPVTALSTIRKVNRGAIAGGIIAGLAVLAAIIALFFYRRYSRRSSTRGGPRRWSGLTSTDAKGRIFPQSTPRSPSAAGTVNGRHIHSESIGPILLHDSNVYVIGNVGITSRAGGEKDAAEDVATSEFALSQEKLSSPQHDSPLTSSEHPTVGAVPLDFIAVPSTTPTIVHPLPSPRTRTRPRSTPGPTSPINFSSESYPPSPSPSPLPSPTQAARRSSTGEALGRRITRKAVPEYNPDDPALTHSRSITPAPVSRPQSAQDLLQLSAGAGVGAPVHYLIPDMPPPQR
ncbi:hypothetical protein C8F01DRAFT_1163693 [Mycena amicta]|nr:hypothetical protein C8F01DRAFT_1163693 [Mycena amicta]